MSDQTEISFLVNTTNNLIPLGFEAWINDQKIFDTDHLDTEKKITATVSDDPAEHELKFVLKNKLESHTVIDKQGNIVSDATVKISHIMFDEIELKQLVARTANYRHNFNGTGEFFDDIFYDEMGCNGTVTLKFTTPVYLWFLELL